MRVYLVMFAQDVVAAVCGTRARAEEYVRDDQEYGSDTLTIEEWDVLGEPDATPIPGEHVRDDLGRCACGAWRDEPHRFTVTA